MKKFLSVMLLVAALIVGGCGGGGKMTVDSSSVDNEIKITAENASDSGGMGHIKISDGEAIHVDAKISAGKLIIRDEGKQYTVDKSGESFIDVPAGEHDRLYLDAVDGLTGEIILRAQSKN